MKIKQDYDFYLRRFQEVVCFLTANRIRKNFKTVAAYKNAKNSSKAYCLNIKHETLTRLSRLPQGKRCFEEFIKSSESLFVYHRHCHKTFKDNKRFSRNSWFELSESALIRWFEDAKNFNTSTCRLISKTTHKWIDKYVFNYKDGKKMIDNSDIPEDDKQPTIGITKEWLQSQVNEENCSKTFAKNCWKILSDNVVDFQESKNGWSVEDSYRTKNWRLRLLCVLANNKVKWNIDDTQYTELVKLCNM